MIREARLRAGLTQQELAERSGRERSVIARWEQGAISPGVDNLLEVIQACGFELPLQLVPRDEQHARAASQERELVTRAARAADPAGTNEGDRGTEDESGRFDPFAILAALDQRRVAYVLVGSFARAVRGAEELPEGIAVVPSTRGGNVDRATQALTDLGAEPVDQRELSQTEIARVASPAGKITLVLEPAGTRGYDDLRRAATPEYLGRGLRVPIASTGDLARMTSALNPEQDIARLHELRRITELERSLGHRDRILSRAAQSAEA